MKGLVFFPITLVLCLIFFSPKFAPPVAQFNEQKWKSGPESRLPMARILIDRGTLNGMSTEQLFLQLGEGNIEQPPKGDKLPKPAPGTTGTQYEYPMTDDSESAQKDGQQAYLEVIVMDGHVAKAWILTADSKVITGPNE